MRSIILVAVSTLAACGTAPAENSPVAPAVVCDESVSAENSSARVCADPEPVITNTDHL